MDLFDILSLIGGLCLFLFGMNLMGEALERRAGSSLRTILGKLTTRKSAGFLTGLGVTAIIQSSSATTVMVVGFVNSGLLALSQAINVIMGANVGTTVTAWILSLSGIEGDSIFVRLLKPTSFTPILALVGIILYMFCKGTKKKDTGLILLGFAVLMFGMDAMSSAVSGLKDVEGFRNILTMFSNPLLGVLAGAVLTAIIQSSSASVGILQALSATGQITIGSAVPIIMGQNIGTCVTALISSVGTNKNARRAALVHLFFNIFGTIACLIIFTAVRALLAPVILSAAASEFSIAVCHTLFNVLCTLLLLPMSGLLEKFAVRLIPDTKTPDTVEELDERLLTTPAVALDRSRAVACDMARCSESALLLALDSLREHTAEKAQQVREYEEKSDRYEDILGTYLVRLSALQINENESAEAAMLLKAIGEFERISDHSVNILEAAEEMREKKMAFSAEARAEMDKMIGAVREIMELAVTAFANGDSDAVLSIEPLEQVIDEIREKLRTSHILRLQQGSCTIDAGFVWSDLLTDLERVSDHCSNIAGCLLDFAHHDMNMHEHLRDFRRDGESFRSKMDSYNKKYAL